MAKLSKTQQEVVERLQQSGRPLMHWLGGYWTDQVPPPNYSVGDKPNWWCGTRTVTALEGMRVIASDEVNRSWIKRRFTLTEKYQK